MLSNKRSASPSYPHNPPVDNNVPPAPYQSRVRSLLGVPDAEHRSRTFSPPSPPVGFRYANDPLPDEAYSFAGPSPVEITQDLCSLETRTARAGLQDALVDNSQTEESSITDSSEESKQPEAVTERVSLEIPGFSERHLSFPALAPVEKGDALSDNPGDAKTEVAPQADPQPQVTGTPSWPEVPATRPTPEGASSAARILAESPQAVVLEERPALPVQKDELSAKPSLRRDEIEPVEKSESSARPTLLPAGPDTAYRGSVDAAEKIEQLRHAVHELRAKMASQSSRMDAESKSQQAERVSPPPPPAQPVVIVQQSISRARTPHAFWERRHLGRSCLRTLR
jgi:hypothetical protein